MVKMLPLDEAPANLRDFIASLKSENHAIVLMDKGEPVAAVLSPEEFETYREARIAQAWATIDRIRERNAHLDPDEVYREVTEIVEEVRRERYEAKQQGCLSEKRHETCR